jgi:hypothetical protein
LNNKRRQNLLRIVKIFGTIIILSILYVTVDFFINVPTEIATEKFRIPLPALDTDQVYFFKGGNKQVVIIRYSEILKQQLKLDPLTHQAYFVAYALGTYLECPLQVIEGKYLKESCSSARYDFAGRPVDSDNFTSLRVPVYNFCPDYSCINLRL